MEIGYNELKNAKLLLYLPEFSMLAKWNYSPTWWLKWRTKITLFFAQSAPDLW